jgi:hypothetical protein
MNHTEIESMADPVIELERFCAELGRELETVQRERTALWEESQRLRAALESIVSVESFQKPSVTWRDLTLDCIRIAKAALGDNNATAETLALDAIDAI